MNRIWVRFSLAILVLIAVILILPLSALFIYVETQEAAVESGVGGTEEDGFDQFLDTIDAGSRSVVGAIPETVLATFLLSGVVGIGAGVWISRRLSKPIAHLAQAAQQIGAGDFGYRVSVDSSQEIADLATAFNRMATDLERSEQLRRNLLADVTHELNTPLTVLEGHLRAAIDHVYELDEAEIANLYGQTRHLISLVTDMRELALAEANQLRFDKRESDLAALVDETVQLFQPLAEEEGVGISAEIPPAMPPVCLDEKRFRQVLDNLIGNALRHTPSGGTVTVRGGVVDGDIELAVQDSGEGMQPVQLAHVFDRFYRTDPSRSRESGGSGLGLAIVKALVEAHGGRIWAESDGVGQGARFVVRIPMGNG